MKKKGQHRLPHCLKPKKTNTLIKKSIFNRPETKKNKHSHWKNKSGFQNILSSNEKRHSTVVKNAWGQTNTLIANSCSTALKPKKQKLPLKKIIFNRPQFKKKTTFIEKTIFSRPGTKKTKTFIEKSIFNRPEPKKTKTRIEKFYFQ